MHPYTLVVGQALIMTQPETIHTVKAGESPFSIAVKYGISVQELYQNNPELSYGAPLYPNQVLVIQFQGQKLRTLSINGYAYPFVNRQVLRRTLPFLTFLSIFSYGMTADGNLISVDDAELLSFARTYQALPVLVLTSLDETGRFSSVLVKRLLEDMTYQNQILDQIIQVMLAKGYRGLDSDFEYIPKENASDYISFLENARSRLEQYGMFLHTALAPKTSADQPGLLYEGHNYREIGAVCDRVLLMTYEWGYTYVCLRYR
jgi:spore germination protein